MQPAESLGPVPSVSVLVPAYDAERFVDEAIASVIAQTFGDWEIVAVDDASRDATAERLETWSMKDARIRVHRNRANLGMTANWNRCLSLARGAFVLKLDADDALRPRALEVLVGKLQSRETLGTAVRALLVSESGEVFGAPPGDAALMDAGVDPYRDQDLPAERWMGISAFGHQLWSSSAFLLRREWLERSGGWDERFGCASDTDMVLRLLRSGGVFRHCAYAGLLYRTVGGSVSDVYRKNGWLDWEATAVYLRNLQACPELLRRNRRARQRRVVLWKRWQARGSSEDWRDRLPQSMRERLEQAMRDTPPPPLADRAFELLRAAAGRFPV